MTKHCTVLFLVLFCTFQATAQHSGPRLFLDIPHLYFSTPDVNNIGNLMGLGLGAAFNVGTHNAVLRIGGGSDFTVDSKSNDLKESFAIRPYGMAEAGVGIYRSNGNKCAKSNRAAYTLMAKGGVRYRFDTEDLRTVAEDKYYGMDYTVGAELGYFYIRDVFKNYEVLLTTDYYTRAKVLGVTAGFKLFLNLRGQRR